MRSKVGKAPHYVKKVLVGIPGHRATGGAVMATPMWRNETVYLIISVSPKRVTPRIVTRKPTSLKQNEFAYKFTIQIDMNAWQTRIKEYELRAPNPPEIPKGFPIQTITAKVARQQVMDRLTGNTEGTLVEKAVEWPPEELRL